jgi:ADP-ribosyl-[dinitrogen reductase] hydrolase
MPASNTPDLASRIRGSFYGHAVVDALGGPVEFKWRGTFPPVTTMLPNDNFNLPPGHFTDDTSMALCLTHSLLEYGIMMNQVDQASKYIRWWRHGWMSSTGYCFDIGVHTSEVLAAWEEMIGDGENRRGVVEAMDTVLSDRFRGERRCGNGSLMRVLPAALLFSGDPRNPPPPCAGGTPHASSNVTHPHWRCGSSCELFCGLVGLALIGRSKQEICAFVSEYLGVLRDVGEGSIVGIEEPLHERFEAYKNIDDFTAKPEADISSSGYVLDSLEAALWAFFTTDSFREGAIKVVNLGDDADTVGAIYGGLAGAFYGQEAIPEDWLRSMARMDLVEDVVVQIIRIRTHGPPSHWEQVPEPTQEQIEDIQRLLERGRFNLQ